MSDQDLAEPSVSTPAAASESEAAVGAPLFESQAAVKALDFLKDVPLEITVELGRTKLPIGDLFNLGPSSVIELTKASDEPLDVRVNGVLVARGEAVVVNDRFGVRLTSVVESARILDSLK